MLQKSQTFAPDHLEDFMCQVSDAARVLEPSAASEGLLHLPGTHRSSLLPVENLSSSDSPRHLDATPEDEANQRLR